MKPSDHKPQDAYIKPRLEAHGTVERATLGSTPAPTPPDTTAPAPAPE